MDYVLPEAGGGPVAFCVMPHGLTLHILAGAGQIEHGGRAEVSHGQAQAHRLARRGGVQRRQGCSYGPTEKKLLKKLLMK